MNPQKRLASETAGNLGFFLVTIAPPPFKTYGKRAFTPEWPAQVLVGGHLVDAAPRTITGSLAR